MEGGEGYQNGLGVETISHGPLESTWAWKLHHTYLQNYNTSPEVSLFHSLSPADDSHGSHSVDFVDTEPFVDPVLAFMHEVLIEEDANEYRQSYAYQAMGYEVAAILQQDSPSLCWDVNNHLLELNAADNALAPSRINQSAQNGRFDIEGIQQQDICSADVGSDFRAMDNSRVDVLLEMGFDGYGRSPCCASLPSSGDGLVSECDLPLNMRASLFPTDAIGLVDESRITFSMDPHKDGTGRHQVPPLQATSAERKRNIGRPTMGQALVENQVMHEFDANCNGSQPSLAMSDKIVTKERQMRPVAGRPMVDIALRRTSLESRPQGPSQTFRENGAGTEIDILQGANECVLPPEKPMEEMEIKPGRKRGRQKKEGIIDLNEMLMQCAQFQQSVNDMDKAMNVLNKLKGHVSQYGDGRQRVAYYFVEALKARMSGRGGAIADSMRTNRAPASVMIKANRAFVSACPYTKLSHFFANQTILDAAEGATCLHVVDFGILYGFQWPSLMYALGARPSGPPLLRITGIDNPHPGLNPAERLEDTGRRLADYARTCRVTLEYQAVACRAEKLDLNDLNLRENEVVVVNCINRLRHVMDETAGSTARQTVLKKMRSINPKVFVLGVVSAGYNSPFFITRFREVLYHFSAVFDSLDNTMSREDPDRFIIESKTLAHVILGAVACEGTERVERPEKYKQWQSRVVKAGFKQLPIGPNIRTKAYNMLRSYHAEFGIGEEGHWMLLGWKGCTVNALSAWCPD
eukprot:c22166_g1_i1 orf=368-2614(-)